MRNLPPLNSLKAFEAAARLESMNKAADELCVTHGAISRQVSQLESWLDVRLFERAGRQVRLTPVGKTYQQALTSSLDWIERETERVLNAYRAPALGIVTTHTFANRWLMKRLPDFQQRHPDVDIRITLDQSRTRLGHDGIDVGIRMGRGPWPECDCLPLMNDRLIVVCSPALIEPHSSGMTLDAIQDFPLLHDQDPDAQWSRMIPALRANAKNGSGTRLASTDLVLTHAVQGQGMALVSERMAETELATGQLIQPVSESIELGQYHWLVAPLGQIDQPIISDFTHWLRKQTAELR
ncbi:LysR substrate-binding domain-containing protein [Saccharospirillum salsuginis]|uniref:Transcriptional regulator n=1 Tax=Saccharospirillum salsuginis TaxID=418750 RepID=A0A918KJB1_9GAMM|nr:LysR substrate-binding domain-containing protein [Saccharospirillum salsuginis]GGX65989.1 transcriptional regulator [Saccharospirillum salsuginis]